MIEPRLYRFGVVGVFTNNAGEILVCERANAPGAWQFPQGGIDEGESPDETIRREVREELGTSAFEILAKAEQLTTYHFPKDAPFELARQYVGQKHYWYHLQFVGDAQPQLEKSDGEFINTKWVASDRALDAAISWKRQAYETGLRLLGIGGY